MNTVAPVLATGGTRTNRPKVALTRNQWAHGAGLRPRVAPLLGVEYTGTPFERTFDRFAIRFTGARMRASGLRGCARGYTDGDHV